MSAPSAQSLPSIPPAAPDPDSAFGVDLNINMSTIDQYLGRDDVFYVDARMMIDPADFPAVGGENRMRKLLRGFKVVSYPYLATLPPLPLEGTYKGDSLISLSFDEQGRIASCDFNYEESLLVIDDLFPKDKCIFIACGAGGYASFTKDLLIHLGWDASKLYNIGGVWSYTGPYTDEIIKLAKNEDEQSIYATWRADYAYIDFDLLHEK